MQFTAWKKNIKKTFLYKIIDDKDGSRFTDYRKSGNEGDMYYVFLLIARNPNAVE